MAAANLPRVFVDGYGEDVRTKDGYFGELVSNGAFKKLVTDLRGELAARAGGDPIEDEPAEITRGRIDKLLKEGDAPQRRRHPQRRREVRAEHREVVKALFKLKNWSGVERIVVGGGFRESRVGELVIGRAAILVREFGESVEMTPIRHHPDEAGMHRRRADFPAQSSSRPRSISRGRHRRLEFPLRLGRAQSGRGQGIAKGGDRRPSALAPRRRKELSLDACMERLGAMLHESRSKYGEKHKLKIAPLVGVGVPGTVLEDGGLEGGVLNLPGDWKVAAFQSSPAASGP